jgi:hypothetical protein
MGAVAELTDEEWGLVEHLFDPPVHMAVMGPRLVVHWIWPLVVDLVM